jgi:hypothetical protein
VQGDAGAMQVRCGTKMETRVSRADKWDAWLRAW